MKKNKLKRRNIETSILSKSRICSHQMDNRWRWGEVMKIIMEKNITLQPTDILEIGYTEEYDEGDISRDAMYDLNVLRFRKETDDEFNKRKIRKDVSEKANTERRKSMYLKLKKEFENE